MLIIELDYEIKKTKSIFSGRSGIYERHRKDLIQPEIIIKAGMFTKERNITQALLRQKGISADDEERKGESGEDSDSFNTDGSLDEKISKPEANKRSASVPPEQPKPIQKGNTNNRSQSTGIQKG